MRAWLRAAVLGTSLLVGACRRDDAAKIDEFVAATTGELTHERVAKVLDTYVDLAQEPLDVRAFGETYVFEAGDRERLVAQADDKLSRLYGSKISVLRRNVDLEGEQARVRLETLNRNGMGAVRYELRKRGERWLLSSVAVER